MSKKITAVMTNSFYRGGLVFRTKTDPHDFKISFNLGIFMFFKYLKDDVYIHLDIGQKVAAYFFRPLKIKNLSIFYCFFVLKILLKY